MSDIHAHYDFGPHVEPAGHWTDAVWVAVLLVLMVVA